MIYIFIVNIVAAVAVTSHCIYYLEMSQLLSCIFFSKGTMHKSMYNFFFSLAFYWAIYCFIPFDFVANTACLV